MNVESSKHLVLIGINFPIKKERGDKNFWLDLIPLLAKSFARITILSVRNESRQGEEYCLQDCKIRIKFLPTSFMETPDLPVPNKISWSGGAFPHRLAVIEKFFSARKICDELLKLSCEFPFDRVHLMDNFGFANKHIVDAAKVPVSISAVTYQGRRPQFIYNYYLRVSFKPRNLEIIAYNQALQAKLTALGIPAKKIRVIPWGVYKDNQGEHIEIKKQEEIKAQFNIPLQNRVILWSGYLQQIGRRDFLYALSIAKMLVKQENNLSFVFAFKPENFARYLVQLGSSSGHIIIKPTSRDEFNNLLKICDVFFSPVLNRKSIVAPPLTWIEVLSKGIPVVTTPVSGTSSIILQNQTGFVSWDKNDLVRGLKDCIKQSNQMRGNCVGLISNLFNIEKVVQEYIEFFNT